MSLSTMPKDHIMLMLTSTSTRASLIFIFCQVMGSTWASMLLRRRVRISSITLLKVSVIKNMSAMLLLNITIKQ